jgi:GT2 family glycosyltransferase
VGFEVIVVDDSEDETPAIVSEYNGVRLLRRRENMGVSKARNLGASVARGDYLAFVDDNTVVDPMWLASGIEELRKRKIEGPLQFRSVSLRNPERLAGAGLGADGDSLKGQRLDRFTRARTILFPVGAGFLVTKTAFQKIGGFDDRFFFGWEDLDLGWRGWLLGFPSICVPSATIYHDTGEFRRDRPQKPQQFGAVRNLLCSYIQNLSGRVLLTNLPILAVWYPFHALLYGRLEGLRAIYEVLFVELREVYLRRIRILTSAVVEDEYLMPYLRPMLPKKQFAVDMVVVLRYLLRNSIGRFLFPFIGLGEDVF